MQLLTEAIKAKLPNFDSNPGNAELMPGSVFVCKFFDPCGSWTWYVLEGQEVENGDWRFYGLVDGFEREWGYFMLSELESVRGPLGIGIERDLHFEDVPVDSWFELAGWCADDGPIHEDSSNLDLSRGCD